MPEYLVKQLLRTPAIRESLSRIDGYTHRAETLLGTDQLVDHRLGWRMLAAANAEWSRVNRLVKIALESVQVRL